MPVLEAGQVRTRRTPGINMPASHEAFYQRNGFQLQGEGEVTGPNLLPYFPMEKILSEPEGA